MYVRRDIDRLRREIAAAAAAASACEPPHPLAEGLVRLHGELQNLERYDVIERRKTVYRARQALAAWHAAQAGSQDGADQGARR
jgi:hypothetical protein